jgi:DNA-binding FrmR family transcriptional regulator
MSTRMPPERIMADKNRKSSRRSGTATKTVRNQPSRLSPAQLDGAGRSALPVIADGLYLTSEAEGAIYNRLSRLEGQVRGVKKMLAEHKSCDDMLVQISALKQAVNAVATELLQAHMETCVLGQVEAGEGKQALASLRSALAKVMKHG